MSKIRGRGIELIRVLHLNMKEVKEHGVEAMPKLLRARRGFTWLDIAGEAEEKAENLLNNLFRFDPLAVDDALRESHSPKVNDWDDYLYLVVQGVQALHIARNFIDFTELDVFVGKRYLVTYHLEEVPALERTWTDIQTDSRFLKRGLDYLLYRLSDAIVNDFLSLMEEVRDAIDQIDDHVFKNPEPETLEHAFDTKRLLLNLRRVLEPQHDVYTRLARGDFPLFERQSRVLFRDVEDHYVRMEGHVQSMRDLVTAAIDSYLSLVNNRLNDVMKVLTIFTALFMPLAFITGFFGMNFFQRTFLTDSWTSEAAFYLVIGVMVLLPVAMFLWMRSRKWM